jgi:predicted oxidoreductase
MRISANYGAPAPKAEGIKLIRTAHDKGVTFFDTAEVYGPYTSEELVLSEKPSHRFATRSLSPQNLATTTRRATALLIVNQSTSGKWLRNH